MNRSRSDFVRCWGSGYGSTADDHASGAADIPDDDEADDADDAGVDDDDGDTITV